MRNKEVIDQVLYYLANGRFERIETTEGETVDTP
jgi:hypothetical protein